MSRSIDYRRWGGAKKRDCCCVFCPTGNYGRTNQ